jgi:hypothetical protein
MVKTKKQLGRKRRVRGGGLWEDFTGFFSNKPQSDPTKPEPPKVEKKVPEKKKSFFERTFSTRYGKR